MSRQQTEQSVSLADLMESAISAASPDRAIQHSEDPSEYRLPHERLFFGAADDDGRAETASHINWSPALKAAYEDGYDPLLWIGRGASADVWRCVDRSFGREVALKIPCLEDGHDPIIAVDALQGEAELLGRLHHPGIVHAVRRSGEGHTAYLALDFIDGDELLEHCRVLKLDGLSRLRLFAKVLSAVSYLHAKGIVHGDLKPDHILVREDDQPVLIDFGLSSIEVTSSLRLNEAMRLGGSGKYRAPEIADHSASTHEPQHDVYALGIILKELLEGTKLGPRRETVAQVISKAIEHRQEGRWGDASKMIEALRPALAPRVADDTVSINSSVASPAGSFKKARWIVAACVSLIALTSATWGALDLSGGGRQDDQAGDDPASGRVIAQASLLDLALTDIYAGNHAEASKQIKQISSGGRFSRDAWEVRHLIAMNEGQGEVYPLGKAPYNAHHALCADIDIATQTVAYVTYTGGGYEIWMRSPNSPARLIGRSVETLRAIALRPGADRVATVDIKGNAIIWHPKNDAAQSVDSYHLPRQADDRVIWFSADGDSLYLFSPKARRVESWAVSVPMPASASLVISECDHIYPLPSSEGAFMVATAGKNTDHGKTELLLMSQDGKENIRRLLLNDDKLPVSADTRPDKNAIVCLGMPKGYVRIHDSLNGGWQKPCDLGVNDAVPAVVYSENQRRAFASLNRIHVIDSKGKLLMRLGDRDAKQQLVTRLHFDEEMQVLTCLSIQDYWRLGAQ